MTNAIFQPLKPYLVMWDVKISFRYNFSYLTSVSFLLFPLLKMDLTNYSFRWMLIDRYLLLVL